MIQMTDIKIGLCRRYLLTDGNIDDVIVDDGGCCSMRMVETLPDNFAYTTISHDIISKRAEWNGYIVLWYVRGKYCDSDLNTSAYDKKTVLIYTNYQRTYNGRKKRLTK